MAKSSARVRRSSGSDGSRRIYLIVGAIIVLFVGGFIALAVFDARQQSASGAPDDVKTYDVGPAGQHTSANVDYDQNPPVGGAHDPVCRIAATTTSPSATRTPSTPWSTVRSGSPTPPTSRRIR